MVKRFINYYKPHKLIFFLDLLAALFLAVCDLVYPVITRKMINEFIPAKMAKSLILWAVIMLGIYLLKLALNYFVAYYGHLVGVGMQADMRRDIFTHLQKLPMKYFDDAKTGTIMSRIVNDLMEVSELAHHGPEDLFLSIIMLVGSFIVMSRIHLPLTLIIFAGVPVMIIFSSGKRKKMSAAFTESRKRVGEINAGLENSISGIRVSKAYTNEKYETEQFEVGNGNFVNARRKAYKAMAEFHSGNSFITDFLMLAMYVAGGLFFMFDKITLADFTAFILYISIFTNPIRRLVSFMEMFQDGMTGFKRFVEIMDTKPEEDSEGAVDMGGVEGTVEFKDVSFSYTDSKTVLDGLSFTLKKGKTLALVGPSGGGKTTICNLIPRFYEVEKGSIEIDGKDITSVTRASLRRSIGIVSQDVFLFDSTIYDNIAYGSVGASREEVERAAKLANIHDYIMTLPDGYDTLVGERGIKLSGGQKQRVSIARVFLKNPPILILDEATSALDNATEVLIQNSLEELCKGRTTIVVAHRLTTVKNADEILVITDRGIEERGTHAELLASGGIYSELWNISVRT
ncbi:MAG: ABC transporter ATP-binding protein [Ruminococcaceae bacterium]|nr:ABC transporter ATP-binding protein [Oscillospiraceae bacterium]